MTARYTASADVIIRTEQWEAAAAFYRETLGLPVLSEADGFIDFDAGAFHLFVERDPYGVMFNLAQK